MDDEGHVPFNREVAERMLEQPLYKKGKGPRPAHSYRGARRNLVIRADMAGLPRRLLTTASGAGE